MTPAPLRLALRGALRQVKYVHVVRPRAATGLVRSVYRQLESDFGMLAPPVALHSPQPVVLTAAWAMLRETLVARTSVDRALKEAVAAAVSLRNTCPYCVEVHGAALNGIEPGSDVDALRGGRIEEIGDERLLGVACWMRDTTIPPPLTEVQRAELIGVAVAFEYLNRMVNVFLPDSPLPPGLPDSARAHARGALGKFVLPGGDPVVEGRSLSLLPEADPPGDLGWARPVRTVADAMARAGAAIESSADWIPEAVRAPVRAAVAHWDGRPPGISRAWVEPLLPDKPADRAVARLALLTALGSSQVDARLVEEFPGGQGELIACTAWASLLAARQRGQMLAQAAESEKTEPDHAAKN